MRAWTEPQQRKTKVDRETEAGFTSQLGQEMGVVSGE